MDAKTIGKKTLHVLKLVLLVAVVVLVALSIFGTVAHASGLVDDTVSSSNLYSKYPLSNYQLDFYVDDSWDWLPWNWLDGIGKSVQYGLYCITNFIWTIILYLSNATGYVVQQAYKLDFINDMADSIGKSIQTLAGVTQSGFSSSGFYVGFLLLIILIVGIYVAYTGLIKRETSKALHAVTNFLVVFLVSASFIAYAPDYIKKVNDFSSDISTASLDLGTKIMLPNSESKGKDSVDLIRDSLFSIQIQQPWLLLQYGNSDMEKIGADRVESLVSVSPSDEDGETREDVVKEEIEDKDNNYLTIPEVINRLGMVFFLLLFDIGITVFIFLLTGMMIFSQILFIMFAMFLPISLLLSMIPSYENMAKQAVVKVFNTIMMRAGITLIVTVAFSISSMFYRMSGTYPFFMVAFLQIVTFAGIYFKLGDLMSMFSLSSSDSQNMGRRIFHRPYLLIRHRTRRMERRLAKAVGTGAVAGTTAGAVAGSLMNGRTTHSATAGSERRENHATSSSVGSRAGAKVGAVMDAKNRVKDNASALKETVKDMPTQAGYAVHSAKEKAKENVSDFKRGVTWEKESRTTARAEKLQNHRQNVAQKRMEMQKAQESKYSGWDGSATTGATRPHERPVTEARTTDTKAPDRTRPATSGSHGTDISRERTTPQTTPAKAPTVKTTETRQTIKKERKATQQSNQKNERTTEKSSRIFKKGRDK